VEPEQASPAVQALPSSQEPLSTTVVFADAESLPGVGSVDALETALLPVSVDPFPAHPMTLTTMLRLAEALAARDAAAQETAPVPPTAGVEQLQPAGALIETKVVFRGVDVATWTFDVPPGPLFRTPSE